MHIGIVSSYGMKCGIAEYSCKLYDALAALGHRVTWFANYNREADIRTDRRHLIRRPESGHQNIVPCFYAPTWSVARRFDVNQLTQAQLNDPLHGVIIQYQNGILDDGELKRLLIALRQKGIEAVVTFHDSSIGPRFPFSHVRKRVCLSKKLKQTIPDAVYIPEGIPDEPNADKEALRKTYGIRGETVVSTFGLGRTDYRLIAEVCERLGYTLLVLDATGSCRMHGPFIQKVERWLSAAALIDHLAASDGIVLWYPDIDHHVSSSAIRQALASGRPVFVNDTNWFHDIPRDVVHKLKTKEELESALRSLHRDEKAAERRRYVSEHRWSDIARRYLTLLNGR